MPVEDHKELRDLVSHTLQAKGVLQKVQAEIRASVFLALEEQEVFKDKNPFINAPLKSYLSTPEGLLAISLIKEFLDFFNLEFTSLVFDPETHAGIDYTYEGRQKIFNDLKIDFDDGEVPLLGMVLKILTSNLKSTESAYSNTSPLKKDILGSNERPCEKNDDSVVSNGIINSEMNDLDGKGMIITEERDKENRFSIGKDVAVPSSLASLSDLPPLMKTPLQTSSGNIDSQTNRSSVMDAKEESEVDDVSSYDEDILLPSHLKNIKENKNDTNVSEDSEIEEDISEAASGPTDDNTVDISVSKMNIKADYLEDIQNT